MAGTPGTVTGRGLNAAGILGWINALDQGLRGDGLGRDGTALTALFNAMPSGGGVIVLPPGTYNLDSSPSVPNNVTLIICAGVTFSGAGALSAAAGGAIADLRNGLTLTGGLTITAGANSFGSGLTQYTTYAARVYNSTNINLSTGVLTALTFDSERYKTDAGMHSTSTNTGRLVATVAGKYRITGHVVFAPAAGGTYRYAQIRVNGATVIGAQSNPSLGASVSPTLMVCATYALALNDYVELLAQQDSGGTIVATAIAAYGNEFEMEYVGA